METTSIAMPQVFTHEDFGEIRTIVEGDKIHFIAADCCRVLDIGNPSMALRNFDDDEKAAVNVYV